jgi:hypothetical protein
MATHFGLYRLHATMKAIYCKYQKEKKGSVVYLILYLLVFEFCHNVWDGLTGK